jgi:hypothetical protein
MIKLVEIVSEPGCYNPVDKNVDTKHKLQSLYINPNFVVEVRESEDYLQKHASRKLIDDLSKDVGFTRVIVSSGGSWTKTYNVVGHPEQVLAALKER